jgi:RNA polymerase sigma factor (sigma-70 family)
LEAIERRVRSALLAWCGPSLVLTADVPFATTRALAGAPADVDTFVADMFRVHSNSLVRLARLFVDDRNAAEDLVQEAFIRLARSAHRIDDPVKAPAYLRSIVLNLTRDHNRRGLVSMRHRLPFEPSPADLDESFLVSEDQRRVLDALRTLPHRQRTCLVLRYYEELGIGEIASTLHLSRNSVKTHLQRGLAALQARLAEPELAEDAW